MCTYKCDRANFNDLEEGLYPYKLKDLLNLKEFHSLNLLKYKNRWTKFIIELLPKIK